MMVILVPTKIPIVGMRRKSELKITLKVATSSSYEKSYFVKDTPFEVSRFYIALGAECYDTSGEYYCVDYQEKINHYRVEITNATLENVDNGSHIDIQVTLEPYTLIDLLKDIF